MELIERYLQAVEIWLPRSQRQDIIRELSDNIRSQVEEREGERGRPLSESDQMDVLRQFGPPILLASRYRPAPPLIGPVLLPFYWLAVQVAMVICGVGYVVRAAALLASGGSPVAAFESFTGFIGSAVGIFGMVTVAFALGDLWLARSGRLERWRAEWDPRRLPRARRAHGPKSFAGSVFGLLVTSAFGAWWLLGLKAPVLVFGPAAALFTWGPVWERLYALIAVVTIGRIACEWVVLMRPQAVLFRLVARLLFRGGELVVCYLLFRARDLVVLAPGLDDPDSFRAVVTLFNLACSLGLGLAVVIGGLVLAWRTGRDVMELSGGSGEAGAGSAKGAVRL